MESDDKKKKRLLSVSISCAIIFTILYFITNFSVISGFFSSIFSVLTPIIVGAAIAYMLNPILKLFEFKILRKMKSKRARRGLSILFTYLTAFVFLAAFFLLMIPQLVQSVKDLASKFDTYVDSTIGFVNSIIDKINMGDSISHKVNREAVVEFVTNFVVGSGDALSTVAEYAKEFGLGLFVGLKNALLGFFISVYILIDKERLHAHTRRLTAAIFKDKARSRMLRYVRIANKTFGNFFIGKIIDSIIIGFITFIALIIFGIEYAPLVSVIVGITNIIPVFGPFFGAIPSAFIIFINNPKDALIFIVLIILIQQLDGNVIGPKILGNSTGISSLGVIVAIVIMGEYFGVVGMIVGVPIFATVIIVVNELIEAKLKKKGLPENIDEYFPAYSLVDPHEIHEKVGERIFKVLSSLFGGVAKKFRKKNKASSKEEALENQKEQKEEETNDGKPGE